jgi:hypothetical protein
MQWQQRTLALAFTVLTAVGSAAAQQSLVALQQAMVIAGDDNFLMRGCVRSVDLGASSPPDMLVWSGRNVMLTGLTPLSTSAPDAVGTSGLTSRTFYWIEDDDLFEHVGQMVEVRGDIKDFEDTDVRIRHAGGFTEIELDIDDRTERVRLPTSWLRRPGADRDVSLDVIARRIDVDEVFPLASCSFR